MSLSFTMTAVIFIAASFYIGALVGTHIGRKNPAPITMTTTKCLDRIPRNIVINETEIESRVQKALSIHNSSAVSHGVSRFGDETSAFAVGAARMDRESFASSSLDFGIPIDPGRGDALVFYGSKDALPPEEGAAIASQYYNGTVSIPLVEAGIGTANCDEFKVAFLGNREKRECIVIMNDYESFHIQRWLRVDGRQSSSLNSTNPLRSVARGRTGSGQDGFLPRENEKRTNKTRALLRQYLNSYQQILEELRPIAQRASKNNTIIVMTCNFGQSSLLINFVCLARLRGFDISNLLVFPTDQETLELAEALGLETFYDEKNFGSLPKGHAKVYGGKMFIEMMHAKVVTVQLISMLGYDILFQDVDIVWYKNPLKFFHGATTSKFDALFQDDGAHSTRFTPYSANSGFYYLRNNERTRYFITSLLYSGEAISMTGSHQQAMIYAMSEHASLFGLKVKTISRVNSDFPTGYHLHRKSAVMRQIVKGEITPFIFHMSWTTNKEDKVRYMQQMGMWFVKEQCVDQKISDIVKLNEDIGNCCLAEPLIICHYRDKASVIPCRDSPPIDNWGPSFW